MYKKQANGSASRSQRLICNAMLELIRSKPYADIDITELCARAEVVRKTFYNNFQTKDDVVHLIFDEAFLLLETMLSAEGLTAHEMLKTVFDFVIGNRDMLILFEHRGLIRLGGKKLAVYLSTSPLLDRFDRSKFDARAHKYLAAQIAGLLVSMLETWIENDFAESADYLATLTESLFSYDGGMKNA